MPLPNAVASVSEHFKNARRSNVEGGADWFILGRMSVVGLLGNRQLAVAPRKSAAVREDP